jgi:hypothetical protein
MHDVVCMACREGFECHGKSTGVNVLDTTFASFTSYSVKPERTAAPWYSNGSSPVMAEVVAKPIPSQMNKATFLVRSHVRFRYEQCVHPPSARSSHAILQTDPEWVRFIAV